MALKALRVGALRSNGFGPVSFELGPREYLCISGESGSGKSRLLRAVADLDPAEGLLEIDDSPRESMAAPAWRRRVGLMPSESHWWYPTPAAHFPTPPGTETLAQLGLGTALLQRPVRLLSTGERQRLALLRLLTNHPQVLLLDEPTANLDPDSVTRVEACIAEYVDRHQAGVVWVSHAPAQRARVATRQATMAAGKLSLDSAVDRSEHKVADC